MGLRGGYSWQFTYPGRGFERGPTVKYPGYGPPCINKVLPTLPWVPEAFLARFPVAAYDDVSEKKTSGTQGNRETEVLRTET